MEAVIVTLFVLVALSGVVVGRWWTLVFPLVVWPIYFLGLVRGWWGYGVGDGWQLGLVVFIAVSLICVAAGIALRALARRRAPRLSL